MASFKQRLAAGELLRVFQIGRIPHPTAIDLFAVGGGYHGFWMDQEHSGITTEHIVTASFAARANEMDFFVRVAPEGYWVVSRSLESGAGGVMAAQITSAEHAEQFVRWSKYAPRGNRGFNTSGRDARYTHTPPGEYAEQANRNSLVVIQIETLGALDEADQIAAIDGVDMLFVGPADMSQALGHVGQFSHEKVWEAIDQVAAACAKHGKTWGTLPNGPEFADRAVEKGCKLLTLGSEVVSIRRGVAALKETFANHF
jgi:4-hydroxy-2-oxoheptanedioate aldolase